MKNENALTTERQPTVEELTASIAAVCSYDITVEQREMARLTQNYGSAIQVTVKQDYNQLTKSE